MSTLSLLPQLDLATLIAVLSTAVVPLLIFLFSRRSQLRELNTSTDANLVRSATDLATTLQLQVKFLTDKLDSLEADRTTERINYTQQLNLAHNENSRVSAIVAELRTNQDIDRRQIQELKAALSRVEMSIGAGHTPELSPDDMNEQIAKMQNPEKKDGDA